MRKSPKAVLFDLDGTLIHSAPDLHAAANVICNMRGWPEFELETIISYIGNGIPTLVKRIFDERGASTKEADYQTAVMDYLAYYNANSTRLTKPYAGVVGALDELKALKIPMAVVTNKPEAPAKTILQQLNLDRYFKAIIGGDSTLSKKPDVAPYLAACNMLDVDLADTIYVGDSETDGKTALTANVPFILFTGGYRNSSIEEIPHRHTIDHFQQLTGILKLTDS